MISEMQQAGSSAQYTAWCSVAVYRELMLDVPISPASVRTTQKIISELERQIKSYGKW
jgi:hypothetical protein